MKTETKQGRGYLETDVDKLYEMIKKGGIVKVKRAAKKFKVKEDRIEEWGRILEEHDLAILHYPPFGDPVLILKKFKPKAGVKKPRKPRNKKALIINIVIIMIFAVFVLIYTGRLNIFFATNSFVIPDLSTFLGTLLQNQIYLALILIIIVVLLLIVTLRKAVKRGKRRGKHAKEKNKGRKGKKSKTKGKNV